MTAKTFGCVGITDRRGHLVGIITDGDLRRHMSANLLDLAVEEVMTPQPRTVRPGPARQRGAGAAQLVRRRRS
jgi:arabinose-5-phosphate isomerase